MLFFQQKVSNFGKNMCIETIFIYTAYIYTVYIYMYYLNTYIYIRIYMFPRGSIHKKPFAKNPQRCASQTTATPCSGSWGEEILSHRIHLWYVYLPAPSKGCQLNPNKGCQFFTLRDGEFFHPETELFGQGRFG